MASDAEVTLPKDVNWYIGQAEQAAKKGANKPSGQTFLDGYGITSSGLSDLVRDFDAYMNELGVRGKVQELKRGTKDLSEYRDVHFTKWLSELKSGNFAAVRDALAARVPEFNSIFTKHIWHRWVKDTRRYGQGSEEPPLHSDQSSRSTSVESVPGTKHLRGLTLASAWPGDLSKAIAHVVRSDCPNSDTDIPFTFILDDRYSHLSLDLDAKTTPTHYDSRKLKTLVQEELGGNDDFQLVDMFNNSVLKGAMGISAAIQRFANRKDAAEWNLQWGPPHTESGPHSLPQPARVKQRVTFSKTHEPPKPLSPADDSNETSPPASAGKTASAAHRTTPETTSTPGEPTRQPSPHLTILPTPKRTHDTGAEDRSNNTKKPKTGKDGVGSKSTAGRPPAAGRGDFLAAVQEMDKPLTNAQPSAPDHDSDIEQYDDDDELDNIANAEALSEAKRKQLFGAQANENIRHMAKRHMERMDEDEWKDAAAFWGVQWEELRDRTDIKLPREWDLRTSFKPYQLAEAFQMLRMGWSDTNGGIFGNKMGMGKTRSMLLSFVGDHALLLCYLEILEATKKSDNSQHNVAQLKPRLPDGACPSANLRTFRCLCDPASEFYGRIPIIAPTILSGTGTSTLTWLEEWHQMISPSKWATASLNNKHPLRLVHQVRENDSRFPKLTDAELAEVQRAIDWDAELKNYNNNVYPTTWTKAGQKYSETFYWEMVNRRKTHPMATFDRPSPTSGRFILVAGNNVLGPSGRGVQLMNVVQDASVDIVRTIKTGTGPQRKQTTLKVSNAFVLGRTVFDEFHNAKNTGTKMMNIYDSARLNNNGYQMRCWALSGTPIETGLFECIIFVAKALTGIKSITTSSEIDKHGNTIKSRRFVPSNWQNKHFEYKDDVFEGVHGQNGETLAQQWRKWTADAGKGKAQEIQRSQQYNNAIKLGGKIASRFILRRTPQTLDPWGRYINGIASEYRAVYRPCHSDMWATVMSAARQRMEAVIKSEFHETDPDSSQTVRRPSTRSATPAVSTVSTSTPLFPYTEMQTFATLPGLAKLKAQVYEEGGSKSWPGFTTDTIQSYCADPSKATFFLENLDAVCMHSEKMESIITLCYTVKKQTRPIEEGRKAPAKIIIGSCIPAVGLVLCLRLRQEFGDNSVEYIPASVSKAERHVRLDRWRTTAGPFILILSLLAFAESITLVEANYIVAVEPQDRNTKQTQWLFRIYRLGQMSPKCYGFVLYNPDAENETTCLRKQMFKQSSRRRIGEAEGKFSDQDTAMVDDDMEEQFEILDGENVDWANAIDDIEIAINEM